MPPETHSTVAKIQTSKLPPPESSTESTQRCHAYRVLQAVRKGADKHHPFNVTLEQVYSGSKHALRLTRHVVDKTKSIEQCVKCSGRGTSTEIFQMGPMLQQVQKPCGGCSGTGKRCRLVKSQETIEVPPC